MWVSWDYYRVMAQLFLTNFESLWFVVMPDTSVIVPNTPFKETAFAQFLLKRLATAFPSARKPCSVPHNPPPLPPWGHTLLENAWVSDSRSDHLSAVQWPINWHVVKNLLSSLKSRSENWGIQWQCQQWDLKVKQCSNRSHKVKERIWAGRLWRRNLENFKEKNHSKGRSFQLKDQ